ncbi:hypothetical protein ACSVDA_02380 [Cytobacillus sp. Hm23]
MAQEREVGELSEKLNIDVSEAITGLKTIQREARKVSQVLWELEAQSNGGDSDN